MGRKCACDMIQLLQGVFLSLTLVLSAYLCKNVLGKYFNLVFIAAVLYHAGVHQHRHVSQLLCQYDFII